MLFCWFCHEVAHLLYICFVGTVVVNPEPVNEDEGSSTPKSAKKRQNKSSLSMSVGK